MRLFFLFTVLLTSLASAGPSKLATVNEFGEKHQLINVGTVLPLPGTTNVVFMTGAGAPVDGTTGLNVAAKGSFYVRTSNGAFYSNTGTISSPAWSVATASALTATLSGLSIAAGTVSSADTVLQAFNKLAALNNATFVPLSQTVSVAGAINTTSMLTVLANAAGAPYAATLAAPSSQDGQIKILKMTTATNAVTLACTNIAFSGAYTPTGTTTLTFSATDHSAIFMAVGSKWVYLGGSAAAT